MVESGSRPRVASGVSDLLLQLIDLHLRGRRTFTFDLALGIFANFLLEYSRLCDSVPVAGLVSRLAACKILAEAEMKKTEKLVKRFDTRSCASVEVVPHLALRGRGRSVSRLLAVRRAVVHPQRDLGLVWLPRHQIVWLLRVFGILVGDLLFKEGLVY